MPTQGRVLRTAKANTPRNSPPPAKRPSHGKPRGQKGKSAQGAPPADACGDAAPEGTALNITELPPELLAHIFRRVPAREENSPQLAAVCRTFRRVCHTCATTVIITQKYKPRRDAKALKTLAQLPQLCSVDMRDLSWGSDGSTQPWGWPISALTKVTKLTVMESWPAKEVPPKLALLTLVSNECRDELCAKEVESLAQALPSGCVLEVEAVRCYTHAGWTRVASWAQRVHASRVHLSLRSASDTILSLACIRGLAPSRLRDLHIFGAIGLKTLDGIEHCSALTLLKISSCRELESLQCLAQAEQLALESLELFYCPALTELGELSSKRLPKLAELSIGACQHLASFSITELTNLISLSVSGSSTSLGFLSHCLPSLRDLRLDSLPTLGSGSLLDSLAQRPAHMASLQTLTLNGFGELTSLRRLRAAAFTGLQSLCVCDCPLATLDGLAEAGLTRLTSLNLLWCNGLESLAGMAGAGLVSLRVLKVHGCPELSCLAGLADTSITALTSLCLISCSALTSLRSLEGASLGQLAELNLYGCSELRSLHGLSRAGMVPAQPITLQISGCTALRDAAAQIKALERAGIAFVDEDEDAYDED